MKYAFYDPVTGSLHPVVYEGSDVELNTPPGAVAIEGDFDPSSQRVNLVTMQVESFQPPQPSPDHVWDERRCRWALRPALQDALRERGRILARIQALELRKLRPLGELALDSTNATARNILTTIEADLTALRTALNGVR